jgi:hypothetical protein
MNDLTLAIIEEDISKIGRLMQEPPLIEDITMAECALALISQAITLVDKEKNETLATMQKIKQIKAFLLADEAKNPRFIG